MAGLPAQRFRIWASDRACHAAQGLFGLPGYHLTLLGSRQGALRLTPVDPWPGDPARGAALAEGRASIPGLGGGDPDWHPAGAGGDAQGMLHGFTWLRDLRAFGGDDARRAARRLAANWIAGNRHWSLPAWRSEIVGRRLVSWLSHYETFFASGEDTFRRRLAASMAAQLRHLERAWRWETRGAARIEALKALAYGALCFSRGEMLERSLGRLETEIESQILPDGGHVERNPSLLLQVLRDLVEIRAALTGARYEVPEALQQAVDRMAPMLRLLRHGDGGLAQFNGGQAEDPALVSAVLDQANGGGKPATRAPAAGFERLAAGGLLVLADSGPPPEPPFDAVAHAGTLSFEASVGPQRLIVNCGAAAGGSRAWLKAQRATAAHSTVTVSDRNSCEMLPDGHIGRRRAITTVKRSASDEGALVTMSHDGYTASDGLIHRRTLYVAASGEDLRGEDALEGPAGRVFAVRFHLHPSVNATMLHSGRGALLKLPKGGGWRLRCSEPMEIADSIYFGNAAEPKRTRQIVVAGVTGDGVTTVRWALRRERRGK